MSLVRIGINTQEGPGVDVILFYVLKKKKHKKILKKKKKEKFDKPF